MNCTLYAYMWDHDVSRVKREEIGTDAMLAYMRFAPTKLTKDVVHLGQVEVDVKFLPPDEVLASVADMLRQKIVELRAESTANITKLEGQLNDLLAIEHKEAS